jgi:hypothetical protein
MSTALSAELPCPLDFIHGHTYARPTVEQSRARHLSDSLLFDWSVYAETHIPRSWKIRDLAWDIKRRAGAERGVEFFLPVLQAWTDQDDFDEIWDSVDRPESDDDQHIIHELASLHHAGELFDILLPDDDAEVRDELQALADWFDDLKIEAFKLCASPIIETDPGFVGREYREYLTALEDKKSEACDEYRAWRAALDEQQAFLESLPPEILQQGHPALTDLQRTRANELSTAIQTTYAAWQAKAQEGRSMTVVPIRPQPPQIHPEHAANIAKQMQERAAAKAAETALPDLITSSEKFMADFESPEYLIDGILQRRYFYSLTAQTGVGKTAIALRWAAHVITGRPLGTVEVEKGAVLYFAGENPSDVQARWIGLSREMGIDPGHPDMHFLVGAMDLSQAAARIEKEILAKNLQLALIAVDTAAAYNFGDDENSNTQAGGYARLLRCLTKAPGGPCVVVLCHPTKRAEDDDLQPRGGGAFLAEVDGNMGVQRANGHLAVSPQGKFRGSLDWVLRYELEVIRDHPKLRDVKGRFIPTVVARPLADSAAEAKESRAGADTEAMLAAICNAPGTRATDLARTLGWIYGAKAYVNVNKANRALKTLAKDKLAVDMLGTWKATPAGEKYLNELDAKRTSPTYTNLRPVFPLPDA